LLQKVQYSARVCVEITVTSNNRFDSLREIH
jgi:hypothetical protein